MLRRGEMRAILLAALALTAGACGPHRPPFIAMPWGDFRMDAEPLPLSADGRSRLEGFFAKGGNRRAANAVMNPSQAAQTRVLDALAEKRNLKVDLSRPAKSFCQDAAALCQAAPAFRGRPLVRQVVDARGEAPPRGAKPLGVSDGEYWYLFESDGETLTSVMVLRNVERFVGR